MDLEKNCKEEQLLYCWRNELVKSSHGTIRILENYAVGHLRREPRDSTRSGVEELSARSQCLYKMDVESVAVKRTYSFHPRYLYEGETGQDRQACSEHCLPYDVVINACTLL